MNSFDVLLEQIAEFVTAQTWRELQQIVEQHLELLTEPADQVLEQLIPVQYDDEVKKVLQTHRELLRRCRKLGIEQAFQQKLAQLKSDRMQEQLSELLPEIRQALEDPEMSEWVQSIFGATDAGTEIGSLDNLVLDFAPSRALLMPFWLQLVRAQVQSGGNKAAVHQAMQQSLRLIIPELGETIAIWMQAVAAQYSEQAEQIASFVENILISIQQYPFGKCAEVLEIATAGYDVILALLANNSEKRSQALNNQGTTRHTQAQLGINSAENLERAIAAYAEAAKIRRELGLERSLPTTLNNQGNAHVTQAQLGINSAENLERAIAVYAEAAKIMRELGLEHNLSITLNNQGNVHVTQAQLGINPDENLERAIATYLERAIAAYAEAAQIRRKLGLERDLASTLNNQGNVQFIQAELGINPAENLERAIAAYAEAAQIVRKLGLEYNLSITLNNQGNVHVTQAQLGINPDENLERAIATYLERAIAAYAEVAEIRPKLGLERSLASILNNQGNVQLTQAQLGINPAENLKRAIAAYAEAAQLMQKLGLERSLASTLNNQGNVHVTQAQLGINPAENLERAIAAYAEAAKIRRKPGLERDLSRTLSNQGNAHMTQAQLDINPVENLERAITSYAEAAQIMRELGLEHNLPITLSNQGNAHVTQAQLGINPAENLERAIAAYAEAVKIARKLGLERDLAGTLISQGTARHTQAQLGINPAENLERAIAAYAEAVKIARKLGLERDLAGTLYNMGNTYQTLFQQEGIDEPLRRQFQQKAIQCYRDALHYFDPKTLPVDTLKAASALGNLHFQQGEWQKTLDEGYIKAIAAVEQTRTWTTDDKRRQELIENAMETYHNAVQCYINLKQYEEAILLTERARSRYLIDLMASNDVYKSGTIPAEVLTYLEQYEDLQQRINTERQRQQDGEAKALGLSTNQVGALDTLKITRVEIQHLYAEKERIWKQLRKLDPVLAGQLEVSPLDFNTLQQLIDRPTTALLSFYSTNDHTYIFILRKNSLELHICMDQGYGALQTWVRDRWLEQYNPQDSEQFRQWFTNMPLLLQELADRLQLNHLIAEHLQGIDELILVPHIYLHMIPFTALPLSTPAAGVDHQKPRYLGDAFRLRTVPSAQVLDYCQQRPSLTQLKSLGLVEDASDDLICARYECEAISQLHPAPTRYRLQGSAQATIAALRQLTQEQRVNALHLSHHASSVLGMPLESALALGDGLITLGQLMSPGWRMPDLIEVFLSCCETALATPTITDDILTLSTGFLCAGARSVVSTLWSVDQLATAIFCIRYYHHRHPAPDLWQDCPTALHLAQQDLRTLPGNALADPAQFKPLMDLYQQHLEDEYPRLLQQATDLKHQVEQAKQVGDKDKTKELRKILKALDRKAQQNQRLREYLPSLSQSPTPFASPFYWAAFTCHGLR